MTAAAEPTPESAPLSACTVSRDITNFDLLIEDMEQEFGESWGDLRFDEALSFLSQPEATALKVLTLALDAEDDTPAEMERIATLIAKARRAGVRVILITENLGATALHQLLRLGADDFVPYPLPEGALHDAVARLDKPLIAETPVPAATGGTAPGRDGSVLVVQGLAGGVGGTTFAVNLAWELATPDAPRKMQVAAPSVCVIDLDLQFGSVASCLDLSRTEAVFELWSDTARMDMLSFDQALADYDGKLKVLSAPADMLPLDFITGDDVNRVISMARSKFDYVIVDMPKSVVSWTEAALNQAHVFFAMLELDMRSAQNALRLMRTFRAEDLPAEKMRFVLNRAPKFTDLGGKTRVRHLEQSLSISIEVQLPDGGRAVTDANDHGEPLGKAAPKSPLRKAISKLARVVAAVETAGRATA
uniref:AAA family ATPase n=1 Tax=Paenirhodobacter enshiensis TaxID=1105367 RepID=UPI0035B2480B